MTASADSAGTDAGPSGAHPPSDLLPDLPSYPPPEPPFVEAVSCDVAVLGTGPVAAAVAARLGGSGRSVRMLDDLESGGDSEPPRPSFDAAARRWLLDGRAGRYAARVVVAPRPLGDGSFDIPGADLDYLGVARAGVCNAFVLAALDPATASEGAVLTRLRIGYLAGCLDLMAAAGADRIQLRAAVAARTARLGPRAGAPRQLRRLPAPSPLLLAAALRRPNPDHFELTAGPEPDDVEDGYAGPATLVGDTGEHPVAVRLGGYLDPNDGNYHWYGRVEPTVEALHLRRHAPAVQLRIGRRVAVGKLAETDPWGNPRIVGVGTPPFALG